MDSVYEALQLSEEHKYQRVKREEKGKQESWGMDPGNLAITLSGVSDDFNGTYNTKIYSDGDGQYNITPSAKYYVEGITNYVQDSVTGEWVPKNKFVFRFAESALTIDAATGTQTITYDIDELSLKVGDKEEVFAVGKTDKTDNIKVIVNKTATGEETITAERNGNKIVVKKDVNGGYSVSIPEAYQEKHGIQIAAKATQ